MVLYCSFEIGQFRPQEIKSVRHVVELFFQVNKNSRSSYGYLKRGGAFKEKFNFEYFQCFQWKSHKNLFVMFLLKSWEFLVAHSLYRSKQIIDKRFP